MSIFLKAALEYEAMGYCVIPIAEGNKKPPKIEFLEYQTRRATREEITAWWTKWPNANIGIVTGEISGLCVADHDRYKKTYSEETALKYFPDNIVTPIAETPRGGLHQYFICPEGMSGNQGVVPGIDLRANGNYIVAPPSRSDAGDYRWILKPGSNGSCTDEEVPLQELPASYRIIINNSIYRVLQKTEKTELHDVTSVTNSYIWDEGTRDDNLFHVAYSLAKTQNTPEYIRQTLRAIILSWGESDEKWITAKIQSAFDRMGRMEKNWQTEVDCYIAVTDGVFSVTETYSALQAVTKEARTAVRVALSRRKDKTIEKWGKKDGCYIRIETDIPFMDFDEQDEIDSPVILPLELHNYINICQGNIILAAGEFNSGKTTFALNSLILNKNRMPIRYLSSEMKVGELKKRFRLFGLDKERWWPDDECKYVELRNNITSAMIPHGLNIIDYLEFPEADYTRSSEYLRQIHDKLTTGVAIVCIQKKENQRMPRSGDLALEKPRLAVTFTKITTADDNVIGIAEILKAKNVRMGKMDGKKFKYEITKNGSQFKTLIDWGFWK